MGTWIETSRRLVSDNYWAEIEIRNHDTGYGFNVPQARVIGTDKWYIVHKDSNVDSNRDGSRENLFANTKITYYATNSQIITLTRLEDGATEERILISGRAATAFISGKKIKLL